MGLLRIGKTLRLVRDCQQSMPPKAGWSTGHGRWRKAVVATWAWRLETRKMNKVGDVQGKQRSRAGLARVAMGIPGSGPSLDVKSMCDPNQVIPMPWDSLSF